MDYPLPSERVIRTRKEAMRYLRGYKRDLEKRARRFGNDVLSLEGLLGEGVGIICVALVEGDAEFLAKLEMFGTTGRGLRIIHLDIDDEIVDSLFDRVGEQIAEDAATWVIRRLTDESSLWISWKLGRIRIEGGAAKMVCEERIQFNLETRDFHSVFSHEFWRHPECKSFEVHSKRVVTNLRAT